MLEPVRPEAVLPDMALCLPTFSHSLIVNKTSLYLSPLPPVNTRALPGENAWSRKSRELSVCAYVEYF
jgi:hypothetical protein